MLSQFAQALIPLALLYLTKLIVDSITEFKETGDFQTILTYILIFGGMQLISAIIQNYHQLITESQSQLVSDYMATVIIDKAITVDISYYENSSYYNTFHQAQRQALYRPVQILRNLSDLLKNIFLLASLAGLLFFLHWSIALILVFFALPIAGVKWYFSKQMFIWEKNRTELEREAAFLNLVLTSDNYAKEVRIFGLGKRLLDKFIKVRKALFNEKFNIANQRAKAGTFAKGAEIIAMTASFSFIAWRAFTGAITIGDLVMFFQAFQRGQAAIQQSLSSLVGLYDNRLFLSHLFELLKVKPLIASPEVPEKILPLAHGIKLKNVNFKYPGTEKLVLKNINLDFKKGDVVALVGENGSGKTTLLKLLCRLYDPTNGIIERDEKDIKKYNLEELRKRITVIYQDFSIYQFSVAENIQIGDYEKSDAYTQTVIAAQRSGANEFIESFPKKYKQTLGRWFEDGQELSGGQWQKIALARAFYKDAEIIVLDEPSSAIDPLAEAEIFARFKEMAKDKILVLITHRLYNLKMADQIVVLNKGEISEVGDHEQLINNSQLYKSMFEKQVN